MLTALANGEIVRAGTELKDRCLSFRCRDGNCEHPELQLVIGRGIRIPHFRHRRKGNCGCSDGETEWHLSWKSQFENVEVDMGVDPVTGEHNRADAVVGEGFVIEFQHSHIDEKEQSDRERFYTSKGDMVWIVDAGGQRDRARLVKARMANRFIPYPVPPFNRDGYLRLVEDDKILPKLWIRRNVGVVFDYGTDMDLLYVLPQRGRNQEAYALCRWFRRDDLVRMLKDNQDAFRFSESELRSRHEEEVLSAKRKEEEQERAKEQWRKILEDAYAKASLQQQRLPYGKLALEAVPGTLCMVGANAIVYKSSDNGKTFNPVGTLRPGQQTYRSGRRGGRL